MEGAWRARQHAAIAVHDINDFFRHRLALSDDAQMQVCCAWRFAREVVADARPFVQEHDLEIPGRIELVLKQLQRSNAATNMAYTPL